MPTILITGAAGRIGTMLRPRLARPGRLLRLLDVAPLPSAAGPGEESVTASVTDMAAMTAACAGADAVIHLGGIPNEDAWAPILDVNVNGTYTVFEAARRAGVPRVVFASSNHAVGFAPAASFPVPDGAAPVPDTYYGVSKAAGEALAALYAHRYGIEAVCVRILSCFDRPGNLRMLATWLSPDDAGRLFEACVTAPAPGFRVIYGVSANTRGGWVSLDGPVPWATNRWTTPSATPPRSWRPPAPPRRPRGRTRPTRSSATWAATTSSPPATPRGSAGRRASSARKAGASPCR